uniref:Uncharacterized protein n=1 Tax=Nelumbo nucifera TaxID=4432 RepID=A0A822YVS2_NELNU|nr:TPA_asm: hypothetical protein HUJ06_008835 [Nelumbo nucifera]
MRETMDNDLYRELESWVRSSTHLMYCIFLSFNLGFQFKPLGVGEIQTPWNLGPFHAVILRKKSALWTFSATSTSLRCSYSW